MDNKLLQMNPNLVVQYLEKPADEFTKADIIRYIDENDIEMVNFLYPGGDGRLKTLNFVINSRAYLETILTYGERVDGSSLFSFVQAGNSDLYVLPRFRTAFVDPFADRPTLDLLCSFFDKDGRPLDCAPEHTLDKAATAFTKASGLELYTMGELEYYVIHDETDTFPATDQHNYHESAPFAKTNAFRTECMAAIAATGAQIKYGHSEVGNFVEDGLVYEQNEIEFLPVPVRQSADQLLLAKWVIRNMAYNEGYDVTFAPKITTGKAGSGLHIHMCIMKNGRNVMLRQGVLSDDARRIIAGLMELAPSLTAFGNRNPTSYFRLVPHQEAPTNICWGDRNRSVLVRVPLGWTTKSDMCRIANPLEPANPADGSFKQTVEIRSGDGSADLYQYLAGICVACRHGYENPRALDIAKETYVDVNIHAQGNEQIANALKTLPDSCAASADCLEAQRALYEQDNIFSHSMIDGTLNELRAYNDRTLRADIQGNTERERELVEGFFHCG